MTTLADVPDEPPKGAALRLALTTLLALALLYGAFVLYQIGLPIFGVILLLLAMGVLLVFGAQRFHGARFIFPGIAAVLIFIAFPVLYTIWLGFTNYSSFNLLSYERAVEVLLSRGAVDPATETPFAVAETEGGYAIWLPEAGLLSGPVALSEGVEETAEVAPADEPATLLAPRDAIPLRGGLQTLTLVTPGGVELRNSGLRDFARLTPEYRRVGEDTLERVSDGAVLVADHDQGFFVTEVGERVPPGWRVWIGLGNFERILASEGVRGPMLTIFVWTVVFPGSRCSSPTRSA